MSEDQTLILSDFAKVIDFNSLYQSYTEARKGKRWKYAVCKYEVNVLENLMFVHFMLSAHKYRLSPYNCFIVKEPKERLIMYNSFRDKIVQHSLCDNVLEPYLSKTFIYDNYASQKGKGTHFGLDRLKYFMSRYYRQNGADGWVLKCDIRKYFLQYQSRRSERTASPAYQRPRRLVASGYDHRFHQRTRNPDREPYFTVVRRSAPVRNGSHDQRTSGNQNVRPLHGRLLFDSPRQGLSSLLPGRNQEVSGPFRTGIESKDGHFPLNPGNRLPGI